MSIYQNADLCSRVCGCVWSFSYSRKRHRWQPWHVHWLFNLLQCVVSGRETRAFVHGLADVTLYPPAVAGWYYYWVGRQVSPCMVCRKAVMLKQNGVECTRCGYRIHGLISTYTYFQNCRKYALNTQYLLNNEGKIWPHPQNRNAFLVDVYMTKESSCRDRRCCTVEIC